MAAASGNSSSDWSDFIDWSHCGSSVGPLPPLILPGRLNGKPLQPPMWSDVRKGAEARRVAELTRQWMGPSNARPGPLIPTFNGALDGYVAPSMLTGAFGNSTRSAAAPIESASLSRSSESVERAPKRQRTDAGFLSGASIPVAGPAPQEFAPASPMPSRTTTAANTGLPARASLSTTPRRGQAVVGSTTFNGGSSRVTTTTSPGSALPLEETQRRARRTHLRGEGTPRASPVPQARAREALSPESRWREAAIRRWQAIASGALTPDASPASKERAQTASSTASGGQQVTAAFNGPPTAAVTSLSHGPAQVVAGPSSGTQQAIPALAGAAPGVMASAPQGPAHGVTGPASGQQQATAVLAGAPAPQANSAPRVTAVVAGNRKGQTIGWPQALKQHKGRCKDFRSRGVHDRTCAIEKSHPVDFASWVRRHP